MPECEDDYEGPATIETYTIFYKRDGTVRFGTIIARTPTGKRVLARVEAIDEAVIVFLSDGQREPVGTAGRTILGDDGLIHWQRD